MFQKSTGRQIANCSSALSIEDNTIDIELINTWDYVTSMVIKLSQNEVTVTGSN